MFRFNTGHGGRDTTLAELLQIEDSPELLSLTCRRTGIPVWAVMRIAYLRCIMSDFFGTASFAPTAEVPLTRATFALGRATAHNARLCGGTQLHSEILLKTDSIGDTLRDGRWFNRYADPFADLPSGPGLVLTDLHDWQLHGPRHNEKIVYHAPIQIAGMLAGRLPGRAAGELAAAATEIVCERARRFVDWTMSHDRRVELTRWAARKIAGLPVRYHAYRRLLRRVQPRLFLGLAGCYGADAPLFAAAKDAGVATGEFQHGSISAGHEAYNFASAIFASAEFRRTLPSYLLTYGPWWSGQVNAPVECVAIGNPTRAVRIASIPEASTPRRTILVLGDGIAFNLYYALAQEIAQAVAGTGLQVALRPHPLEREHVLKRYGDVGASDIRIDVAPDIFASFASAHTVVSEVSTGLFEAVGLVDRIVLLDTTKARFTYPEQPFAAAGSTQQVIEWICGPHSPAPRVDEARLWPADWRANYTWFLRDKIGIDPA